MPVVGISSDNAPIPDPVVLAPSTTVLSQKKLFPSASTDTHGSDQDAEQEGALLLLCPVREDWSRSAPDADTAAAAAAADAVVVAAGSAGFLVSTGSTEEPGSGGRSPWKASSSASRSAWSFKNAWMDFIWWRGMA